MKDHYCWMDNVSEWWPCDSKMDGCPFLFVFAIACYINIHCAAMFVEISLSDRTPSYQWKHARDHRRLKRLEMNALLLPLAAMYICSHNEVQKLLDHTLTNIHDGVINVFRVIGHLCWEFTGHRWIPHTKASDVEFWCFLWSAPEWSVSKQS